MISKSLLQTWKRLRPWMRGLILWVIAPFLLLVALLLPFVGWPGIVSLFLLVLAMPIFCGLFYLVHGLLRRSRWRWMGFVAIFAMGVLVYDWGRFEGPWEDGEVRQTELRSKDWSCVSRLPEAMCRSLSAFFPSRGDYETPAPKGHYAFFYAFHVFALLFVTALLFSLFGRRIVDWWKWWWFRTAAPENLYVFWDYNTESELLARDIAGSRPSAHILFNMSRESFERRDDNADVKLVLNRLFVEGFMAHFSEASCMADHVWPQGKSTRIAEHSLSDEDVAGDNHFVLGEDTYRNVKIATHILDAIARLHGHVEKHVYIRMAADFDPIAMEKWADAEHRRFKENGSGKDGSKNGATVFIHIVNESALVANLFLVEHSMLDCPDVNVCIDGGKLKTEGAFRLLLIGLGAHGRSILNAMICGSQFKIPVEADVVDNDGLALLSYTQSLPEINECCTLLTKKADGMTSIDEDGVIEFSVKCGTTRNEERVRRRVADYNRIVVCTGDDGRNLLIATKIVNAFRSAGKIGTIVGDKPVVFVNVHEAAAKYLFGMASGHGGAVAPAGCATGFATGAFVGPMDFSGHVNSPPFVLFGDKPSIYRIGNLTDADRVAMWLNGIYKEKTGDLSGLDEKEIRRLWMDTPLSQQESSRSSARGQRNFFKILVGKGEALSEADKDKIRESLENGETAGCFAELEHLRWNADRRVHGIRKWSIAADCPNADSAVKLARNGAGILKANQEAALNRHAALVDYSNLPDVDKKLWEESRRGQEQDRNFFVGPGSGVGEYNNLQWNDLKFVKRMLDAWERANQEERLKKVRVKWKNTIHVRLTRLTFHCQNRSRR